ncbi:hypothetical protein Patl1_31948 [Pistacia atlantica]|uniref:Uncharacterized protein n=1 Tax=Pistacia atlantica TaxID=434234 RepID=A0ACC1AQU4_9ROSI|nr:hypothetical protein Patl1_31948 [Pistacia atlantica]
MQISNRSLPRQCGRNWRKKTRNSLRPTQEIEQKDKELQKLREKKGSETCFQILLLKIPKPITSSFKAQLVYSSFQTVRSEREREYSTGLEQYRRGKRRHMFGRLGVNFIRYEESK